MVEFFNILTQFCKCKIKNDGTTIPIFIYNELGQCYHSLYPAYYLLTYFSLIISLMVGLNTNPNVISLPLNKFKSIIGIAFNNS